MNVDVQKEVVNGDTTMRVTVNGKPMDVSEFKEMNGEMKWTSEDGEIHIMKMRHDDEYELHEEDEHENGNKKIIRKKIRTKKVSN